jgi:hypothetical protein
LVKSNQAFAFQIGLESFPATLIMGDSKAIEVIIPATILKSREYLLAVTGISARGVAEGERGYPFRVVKQ